MANHNHAEQKSGGMDITAQEKTFDGFIKLVTWSVVVIIVALVFMGIAWT